MLTGMFTFGNFCSTSAVRDIKTCLKRFNLSSNVILFQVYEDPTEKIVEFKPLLTWHIGEENVIEYTLPNGFEEAGSDWVGIYKVKFAVLFRRKKSISPYKLELISFIIQENFTSLDDYITYEYTSRSKAPSGNYPLDQIIYHLEFPETCDLEEDEHFQLLYFQSTGTRGVTGLVGISEPFKAEKRCPSPRFESVD